MRVAFAHMEHCDSCVSVVQQSSQMAQLVTLFGSLANHMLSRYSQNITDCEPKSDDACMHSMNNYH